MTEGSPSKLILRFFMPLLLGMIFQQFYNMMDTMIVGQFLGAKALAAVGGTGSINFMIIGFCMGVCNGFAIPVAKAFGAQDESSLRKYVANSVWLAILFSLVTTIIVCVLCRQILIWMGTPSDIFEDSYAYIFVIFLGIPVVYLYNLLSGILRSLGDSKTPLYFLIISSLLNIVLDLIAILVLDMGVGGAAWATVISQGISGILCLLYMMKNYSILKIKKEEWVPNGQLMKTLCMMGVPMGLQYSITAIGSVILQTAVNSLGSMAVAAITAGNKINMIFCCPFDAMGSTMATYAGQNVGAGKFDRVTDGAKACSIMAIIYSVISCIILSAFGETLALIFVNKAEVEVIKNAALLLKYTSLFFFPLALVNIVRFSIQGMGFGNLAMFAGVCEMIARGMVGFVFVPIFGYTAACFAGPVAWIMADLFLIPAYFYVLKKLKMKYEQDYAGIVLEG
ncbi:MAG: MATE family efflux transporter [Zhenhengia yiwuensis]|nr:MATE family efflux transporter [Zhenhengia yiwuensis]MDY3368017.1 MATE family efflux transporter [Zhenhengia yiwuensis]